MGDTCFKHPSQAVGCDVASVGHGCQQPGGHENPAGTRERALGWPEMVGLGVVWGVGGGGGPSHFTRNLGDREARISV